MNRRTFRDLEVSAVGLGCMGMSALYGSTDEEEGVRTIQRALELGIDFIDTPQLYGPLTNETLVGRAIEGHRDESPETKGRNPHRSADFGPSSGGGGI